MLKPHASSVLASWVTGAFLFGACPCQGSSGTGTAFGGASPQLAAPLLCWTDCLSSLLEEVKG
jgi:hypothetical protein